ncbi:hypothetical protein [Anaeromyxobacter dehalogenans]|nr:hypothetical protein [Anaeromyxobacter dehalogenans]
MNVPVTLAGFSGSWRFREAHLLSFWMASRPWDEGGTRVALVRLPAGGCERLVVEGVQREARAHEPDASRLRFEFLEAGGAFESMLLEALETPVSRTQTERFRAAGRMLSSAYWLVVVRAGTEGPTIRDEAQEFLENCAKVGERPTACVVVLHAGEPVSESRDFSVGCLADGVLQEAVRGSERLWRAYVASRLAWEAAGDLGIAQELDDVVGGVGLFGDAHLEAALNDWASARITGVEADALRSMATHLLGEPAASSSSAAGLDASLRNAGLLWRPVGERRSRPAPWLARALLHAEPGHAARHVLRAAMVNGPLANEALRRCFDLESTLVASLWRKHGELEGRLSDAPGLLQRFKQGSLRECTYYPAGCPATPHDAWCFASLGEVLRAAPELGGRESPETRLMLLRNALSHGHYVSWRTVKDVLELEEELADL